MNREEIIELALKNNYSNVFGRIDSTTIAFADGFEAAQSTMYTEEQVEQAIQLAFGNGIRRNLIGREEIIKSLKNNSK
jgi:hypothetical protein